MTTVRSHAEVDDDGLSRYLAPREDVLIESDATEIAPADRRSDPTPAAAAPEATTYVFGQEKGPFVTYERRVTVVPASPGRHQVEQAISYRLDAGLWAVPIRRLLARFLFSKPGGKTPIWCPPDVMDAQGVAALASLAYLAIVAGYLGFLISQTITFIADEFEASNRVQGDTLAAIRVGVVLAMGIAAWADRNGRRRAMLGCALGGCVLTALGAITPNMVSLGATQTAARGLTTALALLIVVVVAEEMPAGSRAYGASLLVMAGSLGAGMVLWLLPLLDIDQRFWRLLFVASLAFLPLVAQTRRMLPESRRFTTTHIKARFAGHGRRLFLLASVALCVTVLSTPASQFQNEFLRDEWSFSATKITIFTILTVTPAGIGIAVGGRLADVHGKRLIGAIGLGVGALLTGSRFIVGSEALLWSTSFMAAMIGALSVAPLAVYGPELFPTALRAKANVVITTMGVVGSVAGLTLVGRIADNWELGPAIALTAIAPVLAALVLIPQYPETAHRELEDLNPEDRPPPSSLGSAPFSPPI